MLLYLQIFSSSPTDIKYHVTFQFLSQHMKKNNPINFKFYKTLFIKFKI